MMMQTTESVLVVIDIQQKLSAAMPKGVRDRVVGEVNTLSTAADVLKIPVLVTEQYPKGLGATEPALVSKLPADSQIIEKTAFSCAKVPEFMQALNATGRKQVILTGMETHICVLQTALDLRHAGFEVFVIEDAVSSRLKGNQYNALHRMRLAGVVISNVESVLFEWLGDAQHPSFKTLAKLIQ